MFNNKNINLAIPIAGLMLVLSSPQLIAGEQVRVAWDTDPAHEAVVGFNQASGDYLMVGTSTNDATWTNFNAAVVGRTFRNSSTLTSNFVRLAALTADTEYFFKVCSNATGCSTKLHYFKTAPDTPRDMLAISGGDSRSNPTGRREGNRMVAKVRPEYVAFGGDYTNNNGAGDMNTWLDHWQESFSVDTIDGKTFHRVYPIIPTFGNHEANNFKSLCEIFGTDPDRDDVCTDRDNYYAVNIGGTQVRLYTLNTEHYNSATDMALQKTWLTDDLTANAANMNWLQGQYHRSMIPTGGGKTPKPRVVEWGTVFKDHGMNLIVESDSHILKYTYPVVPTTGSDFLKADAGTVYLGEGSWATMRTSFNNKGQGTWRIDNAGGVTQFKIVVYRGDKLIVRTATYDSTSEANTVALTRAQRAADAVALPAGITLWDPAGDVGTEYKLKKAANGLTSLDTTPPANTAPVANAGADVSVQIPTAVNLNGSVSDDGFPGNPLTVTWSKLSGPGTVSFANANSAATTATFDIEGSYTLRLTANDVEFNHTDDTIITVAAPAQNQAPVVSAGVDQTVTLPASASLNGSVSDDGLPVGANVSSTWTKISGPGTVTFANAASASTNASFSVDGSYVLRLTGDDTALSTSDDVAITVNAAPPNNPPVFTSSPVIKADAVENTSYSDSIAGNATDPENDSLTFSKVSGPAWLSISSAGALFGTPGNADVGLNTFSIQVSDAQNSTSDTLNITVLDASSTPVVIESQGFESGLGNWANVTAGDQENWTRDSNGTTSNGTGPSSGDNSTWYMYMETSSAEAYTAGETAILEGPTLSASNRTLTFSYHMYGSNMGTLNVDVFNAGSWSNAVWSITGQQQTSNAAAYALTTVNLASFSGDIKIRFRAVAAGNYRGDVAIDNIEVTGIVGPPVNQAPNVNAGADQSINTTNTTLNGSVTDDGLGGTMTSTWSKVSGPGSVTFANAASANTSADFSALGVYVLRLSASDTQLSSLDEVQVTVLDPSTTPVILESQDFESSMGGWSNVTAGDQEDWTRDSYGTASSGTGPSTGDNSTWYMYLETSSSQAYTAGETAILEGPSINGGNRSLKFSYHMYGSSMGTLNVDVFSGGSWTNGVWSISGQQQASNAAAYLSADVDLSAYSGAIKIRFRGVAAGGYRGDMAIDNVEIKGLQ